MVVESSHCQRLQERCERYEADDLPYRADQAIDGEGEDERFG
jgi:hypothetical protein